MGFSLKKLAEEVIAQVNPFDNGKTAQTVRQARQAPPAVTQRAPAPQQQPSYGRGITGVVNRARDVVDANTTQDRYKRQLQNRPEVVKTYQDDIRNNLNQVKNAAINAPLSPNKLLNNENGIVDQFRQNNKILGDTAIGKKITSGTLGFRDNFDANTVYDRQRRLAEGKSEWQKPIQASIASATKPMVEPFVKSTQKLGNMVVEGNRIAYNDLPRAIAAQATGNKQAMANVTNGIDKRLSGQGMFGGGMPSGFNSLDQGSKGFIEDPNKAKDMLATGTEIGTTIAPVGPAATLGVNAFKQPIKQTVKTGTKALLANGVLSGGESAARQYMQNDKIDAKQVATDAGLGATISTALPFAAGVVTKGAPKLTRGIANQTPKIVNKAGQSIDDVFNGVRQAYDGVPSKQGGFVANPLNKGDDIAKSAPVEKTVDPLESLKQEARKYKSAEEFVKNNFVAHGTNREISGNLQPTNGWYGKAVYTTDDLANASGRNGGGVTYFVNKPQGKLLEINAHGSKGGSDFTPQQYQDAIKNGYDGLKIKHDNGKTWYAMFNEQTPHTKQQLTDLYNQSKSAPVEKTPNIKKGNIQPDPLTTLTGQKVTLPQYNPKATSNAALSKQINESNQALIYAAIKEAKAKGDDFNLGTFEDMNVKNLSQSDIEGVNLYLFGDTSVPLTYNGKKPTTRFDSPTPVTAPIEKTPNPTVTAIEEAGAKIKKVPGSTSSGSLSGNALEPSVSSPRNSGQKTIGQTKQVGENLQETKNIQNNQELSYPNSTPNQREVKLNTGRLNPDNKDMLPEMDKQTTEVINSLSNKDIERISKDVGIDTKTNSPEMVKKKIAEQLNVRRDAVRYMNEAEIARKAGDLEGAKQSMLKAAEAGRISRAQGSELGQMLQARKIIANELDTPQQRIFKLLDAAGVDPEAYVNRMSNVDFNNSKQVVEAYRDLVPAKKAEWLDTVRYNSMLSSPLTQAVNVFGNAQNVALVAPVEKTLRGIIDAVGGVFGKERRYAAGEGLTYSANSIKSIGRATRAFRDALSGKGKYANPDFDDYNIPLATKGVSGAAYKTLSFPMRVLDGMDKFFRTMAEAGEGASLNLREKKGIKLNGNRSALMEDEAAYRVFQQELHKPGQGIIADASDSFAELIMSGRNSKNILVSTVSKFTVPFVKTINNINKQGIIEYSPLGIANMVGNTDKVTALTRATMGTAIFGISSMLVGSGNMTWAEPRNAEERARFRSEGKQPYAVKVGGKWVNFSKLTPAIAFPMAMTAALDDALKNKTANQGNVDAILEAVSKYGNFLADQSYAKSVGDMLGAIGGDKEAVANTVSNNIQQVIPFRALTGWVARMSDSMERKVDTTQGYIDQQVQMLMQQYPGLRQKTPTRDYQGSPIPANNQIFNGISPVRVTTDRGVNAVDAELDATKAEEEDPLLNKSQLKEIDTIASARIKAERDKMIASEDYKALSTEDKRAALNAIAKDIKAVAKKEYQATNKVGEYAEGYTGKEKELTGKQKQLALGNTDNYLYAGLPKDLPPSAKKILTESDGAADDWASKPNTDQSIKDTLKNWNNGEEVPVTNEIAKAWAEYEKNRLEGKISNLEMNNEKKKVLRKAYSSVLNQDERGYFGVPDGDIISGLEQGLVTPESLQKALDVDALLVSKGLLSKSGFGKTVWNALGLNAPKSPTAKTTSSRTSRVKSTKVKTSRAKTGGNTAKGGKYNYNLFMFGDAPTKSKSLRELVKKASAKA